MGFKIFYWIWGAMISVSIGLILNKSEQCLTLPGDIYFNREATCSKQISHWWEAAPILRSLADPSRFPVTTDTAAMTGLCHNPAHQHFTPKPLALPQPHTTFISSGLQEAQLENGRMQIMIQTTSKHMWQQACRLYSSSPLVNHSSRTDSGSVDSGHQQDGVKT